MGRMPVPDRLSALSSRGCPPPEPWRIIRRFHRLSACRGLVAYALRTRAPLSGPPKGPIPFDLHVLGLPLAFILSQDQTLRCTIVFLVCILNLGFRLDVLLVFLLKGSFPDAASQRRRYLVLASDFQRTFSPSDSRSPRPSSLPKAGAKVQLFSLRATYF